MELVSSISRSSGMEVRGDVLKEFNVQQEYRTFIESKLQSYWSQFTLASHLIGESSDAQRNLQSNILILFRKLREGLISSKRMDDFALEVYETSLQLSVLFRVPAQTTSIVNQLVPHRQGTYDLHTELSTFYKVKRPFRGILLNNLTTTANEETTQVTPPRFPRQGRQVYRPPHLRRGQPLHTSHASREKYPIHSEKWQSLSWPNILSTRVISVLHALVHSYAMEPAYHSTLNSFRNYIPGEEDIANEIFKWLKSIATAVISRNYVRFDTLTCSHEAGRVLHRLGLPESQKIDPQSEMTRLAVKCLVEDLRTKVRGTVWGVLTVAYRELDTTRSADWFLQSLMIDPSRGLDVSSNTCQYADSWLEQRGETETRKKEGSEGSWIFCRRRRV